MPTVSTANLEALIREEANRQRAAATAFEATMGNAVAEWAQHQAAMRIALEQRLADAKDEAELARAHAQDLQRQLDAAMTRIRELEGESKPQPPQKPKLATPELLAMRLNDNGTIWFNWRPVPHARNYVLWLQTRAAPHDLYIVVPVTEANRSDGTCGWDVELPADKDYSRWEFWGRIQAQDETPTVQDETDSDWTPRTDAFRVQMPVARTPIELPPPANPGDGEIAPPANARVITTVAEARAVLRTAGNEPIVVAIDGIIRDPIRVEVNRHNVWFIGQKFTGIPGSASGSNALSIAPGASNIHVYRCHFDKCGIALWLHGTRCRIIGNRFADCTQAIHSMWYGLSEDCYIEDNIIERCSGHDVELQTHGTIDERKILARNIYFRGNKSTGTPKGKVKMIWSIAIGHGDNIVIDGNESSGGDWAFEIMTGAVVTNNVMQDCNVGCMVYSKARDVTIGAGNRCRNVDKPMATYHGPWTNEHRVPQWTQQGDWMVSH